MSEWREVCRWDVEKTPLFKPVDKPLEIDWKATAEYWKEQAEGYRSTFGVMDDRITELFDLSESLIAALEELAGEKSKGEAEWEAINAEESKILADMRERSPAPESCPGPDHYYSKGGWKHKPRRSKLAAIEPDHPTVQADPPAGEIGPLQGQGEARNADGTPYIVGESGVGSAIPQSGEERSE